MNALKVNSAELRNRWTRSADSRYALKSIVDGFRSGKLPKAVNFFKPYNDLLDLRGLPLSGSIVIKNISLENVDLSFSFFDSVWLERSNLKNVLFANVDFDNFADHQNNFENVKFVKSDFSNAALGYRSSKYNGCIFDKCKFSKTSFIKAEFDKCFFNKCRLSNIDFHVSSFNKCKFVGKLDDVWFRGKYAFQTELAKFGPFRKNEMEDVDMSDAELSWLTFTGGINLKRIILPKDPTVFYMDKLDMVLPMAIEKSAEEFSSADLKLADRIIDVLIKSGCTKPDGQHETIFTLQDYISDSVSPEFFYKFKEMLMKVRVSIESPI